jgi:hypothetical protein
MAKKDVMKNVVTLRQHARAYGFFTGKAQDGEYAHQKAENFFRYKSGGTVTSGRKGEQTVGERSERAFSLAKKYAKQRSGR